jgi:ATP synthase protein I
MAEDAGKHQPPSLDEFSKRLDAARGEPEATDPPRASIGPALGRALRVSTELLAALFVGGALGWGLDTLTGARPWFLLAGFLFGFAAGVRNLFRALKNESGSSSENG